MSTYQIDSDGITLKVYVVPGSAQTAFAGTFQQSLKVRLQARAIEGQANAQLCQFLSRYFSVPKSSISIKLGRDSRYKVVRISGPTPQLVELLERVLNVGPGI